ncbi:MAG: hypothetical protein CMH62_00900 [Nanoarchaeota archaeon]|nr:hypothetical protein [Nanoarchaeota archaeon]|tara:strand:+ start:4949 stop:5752 length:804 start_codon:yes stop_codon:yes gene_type:complete
MELFKKSFSLLINNKQKVFTSVGVDFIFYILVLLSGFYFFNKFSEKFEIINNNISSVVLADEELSQGALLKLNAVSTALTDMLLIVIGYFILVLILWGIFNGAVWLICKNIIKNKKPFDGFDITFLSRYYILSLFWFLITGILFFSFYNYNSYVLSLGNIGILIVNLPILLILYFGTISFSLFFVNGKTIKSFTNCFKLGLSKVSFLIAFVLFILIFYFSEFILLSLGKLINSNVFSILGIIAFLLIMVWFRVYLLLLVEKYAGDRI